MRCTALWLMCSQGGGDPAIAVEPLVLSVQGADARLQGNMPIACLLRVQLVVERAA